MPRNVAKPLSEHDAYHQRKVWKALAAVDYRDVSLEYVKRDGTKGTATGKVQFFNGRVGYDTGSVTIDTTATKGRPTTVNMHRVTKVS
jgi:hypothetical protein